MKVWEEEWKHFEGNLEHRNGIHVASFTPRNDEPESVRLARARLAAQAPAMAREFLRIMEQDAECPSCNRYIPDEAHRRSCLLAAILRDAGVIP
jgi:hypothetical protein